MTRKKRTRKEEAAAARGGGGRYEAAHLDELESLAKSSRDLAFLSRKISELKSRFDPKQFVSCYHLALVTLKDLLESREGEAAKLRTMLEEFNIPSKALQVVSGKEKESLEARIEEQERKYGELRADFESFKTRNEKKAAEAGRVASEKLVLKILPVLDNLERALGFHQAKDVESVLQGVRMIARQLEDTLEKEGVSVIAAAGASFDPALHEAAERVERDDAPEDTVVEEIRKGYKFKEKVIRPALVKVARGSSSKKSQDQTGDRKA